MNAKQAKYPQLRFKGFTDPWEERYLGDYVVDYTEKTTQENQFPVLTSSQQQGIVLQSEYFSDRQVTTDENIGYFILPRGYFTYRSRSDNNIFVFNRNDIIDKGIISYFYPVFGLINVDSNFFLRRINNGLNRQLAIAAEGTGQHVLSLKKFKKMETRFPSLPEQKQIGEFLECLDDLITVNQRKLAKLKELKQGYLQKLFPRNGSKFPQLRFAGFADAWEERKLGEFVIDYVEKTTTQNQFPVLTSSQKQGIVLQETYFASRQVTTDNNIGYYVLPRGYFTFRSRSDNDVFVFNRNDLIDKGIISYFYPVFTLKNADSDFFLERINNGIKRQLAIQAEGTGQHVLSMKKFRNIISIFPSFEEQQKIGSFFKELDDTIALHQRKLEKLQELKKGYLQKMFC
ncbi:restriction endonuclease subunit S [Lactiplantibacillus plantarum]|uniref:restriction endonuclease subunit S n=1 Tax=Lactiplantibacillus plantarum TaxID=1590 RepID=UPI003AFA7C60